MNNIDNFNKIASILKASHSEPLDRKVMQDYTPRLWGQSLVNRSSCEGKIIDFIRWSISIDDPKKKWKHIFRNIFIPETNDLINKFSDNEKNEIFKLKYTYSKKNKNQKDSFKKSFSNSTKDNLESPIPVHWTKDPEQLKRISLMATWSKKNSHVNTQIVEALFGLNNQGNSYDPIFLDKFTSHVYENISTHNLSPSIDELLNHAIATELKLQSVIETGQSQNFATANLELKKFSTKTATSIKKLNFNEKTLVFGGITARAPKINIFSQNSTYKNLEALLNQDPSNDQINTFLDKIFNQLRPQTKNKAPLIPTEVSTNLKKILEDGFLLTIFPKLNESLINSEQSLSKKILLGLPELFRQGTNSALSFAEMKLLEGTTDQFSNVLSKDLCLELINDTSDDHLMQLLKDKVTPLIKEHLSVMRKLLLSNLSSVTDILPTAATELISALNYGELGSPESPLWLEVSRQDDGKYSLLVYASGNTAKFQGVTPLIYTHLTVDQLDSDFFMRFFSYRAWPKWDAEIQYKLKDIHQELFASLNTDPILPTEQLQSLNNELKKTPGAWGLFKALICSHHTFQSNKDRDLLFYTWKKNALIDAWMELQLSPNFKNNLNQNISLKTASENLAEEAFNLFERGFININEYKSIYATTWEIIETFNQATLAKPHRKKMSIIPAEIIDQVKAFFAHISPDNYLLTRRLIIDILGSEVEPALDEVFADFYVSNTPVSTPQNVVPQTKETSTESFKRLGRKFTNIVLDATIGINLNDLSAPTSYTYFKIAFSVARFAYSIFFSPHALALNLQWAIATVAGKALFTLVETCFPVQTSFVRGKFDLAYRQLNEWKLRLIAYATARLLLNEKQRKDFTDLITTWQSHLSNRGKLSFELPEPSPTSLKTHSFKKMSPETTILSESIKIPTRKLISIEPFPVITIENCLEVLSTSLTKTTELVADENTLQPHKKTYNRVLASAYCNELIKTLPMPLPDNQKDVWSQVNDPHLHLETLCTFTLKLYNYSQQRTLDLELKNQIVISLYKAYAIIDKLARRCPEADLDGYKVNPWALALLKKNAFFRIVDSHVQEQFIQVCTYFGIDFRKDYSDDEIAELSYDSLFYESKSSSFSSSERSSITEKIGLSAKTAQALSPAERRYYTALLDQPEVQDKLEKFGMDKNASLTSKIGLLYADGCCVPANSSTKEETEHSSKLLPRVFTLLRLTNFLANDFVEGFKNTNIENIDSFSAATYIQEDSSLRSTLNSLTFGNYFGKDSTYLPFRYLPGYNATVWKKRVGNATDRNNLAPIEGFGAYAEDFYKNRQLRNMGQSNFCIIMSNQLHQRNREQNEIINNTSTFNKLRKTESWLFGNSNPLNGFNSLQELSKNERAAIEMLWNDDTDQAVRTLAFFSQRIEELYRPEFFMLFEILLLRGDVLEQQLKTDPTFARTLGEFFKVALAHYTDNYQHKILDFCEIGIYALTKAQIIDPSAAHYFPNFFTKILLTLPRLKNDHHGLRKISQLLNDCYFFVDPSTVSSEDLKKACHQFCQILTITQDLDSDVFSFLRKNFRWIDVIAKTLDENPVIRNEVLNALAKELKILRIDADPIDWKGEYPYFSSGMISLGIDFENGLTYTQEREEIKEKVITTLKKIYGSKAFEVEFLEGQYQVKTSPGSSDDDLLTISIEKNSKDSYRLHFRKKLKKITYRWVDFSTQLTDIASNTINAESHSAILVKKQRIAERGLSAGSVCDEFIALAMDEEQNEPDDCPQPASLCFSAGIAESYWLEEKPTGKIRQLLTLHDGAFATTQSVEKHSQGTYVFLTPEAVLDKTNGVKVDLTQNAYGLGLLAWFQPLASIQAFRSTLPPYNLNQIKFSTLDLSFTSETIDNGKKVLGSKDIPGFYIAEEQRPADKLPALNNFSSYLLLENPQKQNKVILPTNHLKTALGSWVMQKTAQLTSSRLLDHSLTSMINSYLHINDNSHPYFVYNVDDQGRLSSEDPAALLYLLLFSLAHEDLTNICYYLTLFEGCGKRMKFESDIITLIQTVEALAMLSNDPALGRIALRLSAVEEENRLIQNSFQSNQLSPHEKFISWLALQVNMHRYHNNRNILSHLPIDEYQELFILHAMEEKSKQFALDFKQNQRPQFITLFETIGIDYIAGNFLMLPELTSRYNYLKNKYSMDGELKTNFKTILADVVKDKILSCTNAISGLPSTDPSQNENAIQKLIKLITPINSEQLLKSVFYKFSPTLNLKYLFCDVFQKTNTTIMNRFLSDYGYAFNKPATIEQLISENFAQEANQFRKEFYDRYNVKKLNDSNSADSEFLSLVSNPKLRRFFPDPETIKSVFENYQKNQLKLTKIREITIPNVHTLTQTSKLEQKNRILLSQFEKLMHTARYKALAEELSSKWEEVPIHFSELSFDQLGTYFLSYYQLVMGISPTDLTASSEKHDLFLSRSVALKKSLLLIHGKNSGEKQLLNVLQQAGNSNLISLFPNPQTFEANIQELISNLENDIKDENTYTSSFITSLKRACLAETALPTIKDYVFSYAKNQAKPMLVTNGISFASSVVGLTIPAPINIALRVAPVMYQGYQAYNAISQKYEQMAENRTLAITERKNLLDKNNQAEAPLAADSLKQLNSDDTKFGLPCQNLLKKHFKAPKANIKTTEPTLPFDCPSNNPIVKKAFERLNESLADFYARPKAEILPEELNGIENYHELQSELELLRTNLQSILHKNKKNILSISQRKPKLETRSDGVVITSCIKERVSNTDLTHLSLEIDATFSKLITAFIDDNDADLMRLASVEQSQLPQLKVKLYRYLLRATRFQQIERALAIQKKINPSLSEDAETKIRLKQLCFELGRKRAYSLSNELPPRLIRGYLAFEYGSGMMLWDRQVNQLQKMLLNNGSRLLLELIMGSGKTVFGTPMISFFGSNGKEVIANFFPDTLASENIKDLSKRSQNFFGQISNAFKISRDQPLDEDNLWGLQKLLMRALDQKESLNACKKDFQALQLIFFEEAYKALNHPEKMNEAILWAYMKILGFIRNNVRANIDEAHLLLRYNDELNHPLGSKKKVKQSYVNVISECMRLLVAIPEIKAKLAIEDNDQTLCSSEEYHKTIKPLLAKKLVQYRPFAILPEQRELFSEYLCGNLTEIPEFISAHERYSEIGLAVGTLNKFIPDALQKKINVNFGTKGNKHGYAQPYSSKDTPIEGSTFKNPYEAVLKTLMASLHAPLDTVAVKKLILQMTIMARAKSKKSNKPFEETSTALLFNSWTKGRYKLNEMSSEHKNLDEITALFNEGYAPRMSYARLFAVPEIEYFTKNLSCNSQNFASLFSSFYSATGTPPPEEILPGGTEILFDAGTAGEFVDHICHTCSNEDISELQNRSPQEALQEQLENQFNLGSDKLALVDSGSLFYGLNNELVAKTILEYIAKYRTDLKAVVYFNSKNELVIQEIGKEAIPFAGSAIPPEQRITYFDQSHSFGADVLQAIKVGGKVSVSEKTNFDEFMQGCWRMRGLKTAQQNVSPTVNTATKKMMTDKDKLEVRDVITFTKTNEAISQGEGAFPSAQNEIDDVIKSGIYDAMLESPDVNTMLNIFKEFMSLFITSTDEDPSRYGDPEIECDPKLALKELCEQRFKDIEYNTKLSLEKRDLIKENLLKVGQGSTYPETVKLYKRQGKLVNKRNDLGIAQHVSLQTSQSQETTRNQDVKRNQNVDREQNQDLQIDVSEDMGYSRDRALSLNLAKWDDKIDCFASLDWWKVSESDEFSNREEVEFFNVQEALSRASNEALEDVNAAFKGTMHWSSNLQGFFKNGELAEPCSKKQMLELLVIQGPQENGQPAPIITCAIDQKESGLWRKRLAADRSSMKDLGAVKIALFDIALNKFVSSGRDAFDEKTLIEDNDFSLDVARWKFLAGHVNLQKGSTNSIKGNDSLMKRFTNWLDDNNNDKMKNAYTSIYKAYGFAKFENSDMQSVLSVCDSEAIPEIL